MNIFKKMIIFSLFSFKCIALQQVNVDAVSDSGQTVKLNIGTLQGLSLDEGGELTYNEGSLEAPKYPNIISGKAVKVFPNFSYWFFPDGNKNFFKDRSRKFLIQTKDKTTNGRVGQKISFEVVGHENKNVKKSLLNNYQKGVPEKIIATKDADKYEIYQQKSRVEKGDEFNRKKELYTKNQSNVLIDEDYNEVKYLRADEAMVQEEKESKAHFNKVSKEQNLAQYNTITSKKDGLEELFYNGRRVSNPEFKNSTIQNMTSEYYENFAKKQMLPESTVAMIKKEGELWSGDMDKEEVQEYLFKSGIAREKMRRDNALLFKSGNEFIVFFGSNLTSVATSEDPSHQNKGFSLGFGYELYLVRATQSLINWSIDLLFEQGTLNINLGGINGRTTYGALGGHLNYYFLNYPHSRNRIAMYAGIGLKRGNADVTSINLSKDYEYEILAIPSMHIGMKYRVPTAKDYELYSNLGYGLSFKLTLDSYNVSSISSLDDDISGNVSFNNIKADFGLSFFF